MNLATLVQLARPRSDTDRRRMRLLVTAIGIAGAFLLAGWRIQRLGFNGDLTSASYNDFLQQHGLRSGVAIAAALLAISAGALAVQALRLGTAARERRLAALRLAGATPGQVRQVGAVDAGVAGLAGGVLAGPLYLLLTLLLQALPQMARMLPPPNLTDLVAWPIVASVLTVASATVGALLGRGVVEDFRTTTTPTPPRTDRAVIAGAAGLVALLISLVVIFGRGDNLFLMAAGLLLICASLPTVLAKGQGRRLAGSADPLKVLAGGRLLRTARSLGRTMMLLILCSSACGIAAMGAADALFDRQYSGSVVFHLTGFGFVAAAAVFTALIAAVALLAGAADDLLDQRRQLACLSAFGVGEKQLLRSVRHQLTSSTTPAVAAGLLLGCAVFVPYSIQVPMNNGPILLSAAAVVVVGTGLAWLVAAGAAYLLRGHVREAIEPQNIRIP